MFKLTPKEVILNDDHPIYKGYTYIVDNQFFRSHISCNVKTLKLEIDVAEIRRCDLYEHPGAQLGDFCFSEFHKI